MTQDNGDGTDSLRLAIVDVALPGSSGFAVEVHVNGTEMTSPRGGLGMDPYDLLIPANMLLATPVPRSVQIARCKCGDNGCAWINVTITRDGGVVRWEWASGTPKTFSFAAERYDAEVDRAADDHSWETAERTVGRLVLSHVDRDALGSHGLAVDWAGNNLYHPDQFCVALRLGNDYQIFVDVPWRDRGSEELATDVCETLARGPEEWRARWSAIRPANQEPPQIASASWRREPL
ncbi:hypothetical protein HH310_37565 [Actinoplanes sp. TBRC 11911]|uniref:hypothetical protein n=1 Tax=Actinoplanes sp. TBRC 11911 TaxID=2729386 RepID=UPI00145CC78F|nr:hypothetical protein [Actinoplanes sp. TBRC 11911]NMO56869.1 hypothetical protein [Actinoplanes sp. TBRC 11911]